MLVTWEKTWPRWVGIVCAGFGLANVVGALAGPLELMLPGIVIGSVFAALGLKRGPPRFASSPQAVASPSERIARGLRTIRRRRLLAFLSVLAWLPMAGAILPRVRKDLMTAAFFLTALPVCVFVIIWELSACPRCHRHFVPLTPRLSMSFSRCDKCGLGIHDA
jgi:hypothetical protein